jgi:arsenate reductase (thioredoxin)
MSENPRILFVCLHGAAKSVLAAADCERLARSRGLRLTADFAGTEPDADIAPAVAAALRADGVDLGGKKPRRVSREDVAAADRVVAFGCELGGAAPPTVRIDQWTDVPAVSDGLPVARAAIRAHLERLLDEWKTA